MLIVTSLIVVFAILMVGTALTVAVAFFDLGPLNNVVMLTVASSRRCSSCSTSCTCGGAAD